jgi:hypothetical protein
VGVLRELGEISIFRNLSPLPPSPPLRAGEGEWIMLL